VPGFTTALVLSLSLMALISLASLIPHEPGRARSILGRTLDRTPAPLQKLLHVGLYGLLALLLVWSLGTIDAFALRMLTAFIIAVGFGAVMEWCQTRVPGRVGSLADVLLNAAGAALGLLAATFMA
jgi:VanZ family protein